MKTLTDRDEIPYTAAPGRTAFPIALSRFGTLTAHQRLDIALLPFIRPGTPLRPDPIAARTHLHASRRAALVAAAVRGR
jgi:hypothetical protein